MRAVEKVVLALSVLMAVFLAPGMHPQAADPAHPDWPCIQRKVPEISAGMMWAGPELHPDDRAWQESPVQADLVRRLVPRRLPLDEARALVDAYAEGLTGDRNQALTGLFNGLLQVINAERREIMAGIERFARRQKVLASKITLIGQQLDKLRASPSLSGDEQHQAGQLEEQLIWDTRVFDEREESLTYVCEVPVLLEQRLFALARQIMGHLEE